MSRGLRWPWLAGLVVMLAVPALVWSVGNHAGKVDTLPPDAWPTFGGTPARNMVNPLDKGLPAEWSVEAGKLQHVKWVAELGGKAYGGPVISGGRIFVGTNNQQPRDPKIKGPKAVLMCFRQSDGKFLWQAVHNMEAPAVDPQAKTDGLCSTPTVEGQRVYYVTPAAVVVCADAATGKAIWRLDMTKELNVHADFLANCAPLLVGGRLFVLTGNGVDEMAHKLIAPEAPSFLALSKKDGKVLWKSNLPGKNILEGQWANPAYAVVGGKGQVIFPGGDGYLYGLEPDSGKMIWKFNCNPAGKEPRNQMLNYLVATPVVHEGKVYVGTGLYPGHSASNPVGHFWCVRLDRTGDVSPAANDYDPASPANKKSALVWQFGGRVPGKVKLGEREVYFGKTLSTAAVHDGLAYVAEESGFLHCLDAATGKELWQHDLKAGIWGSPYWADGKVYLGTDDGQVVVFAHGRQKKVLATIDMGEGQSVKSTPVSVDGVLYIATGAQLFALGKK
jgi:outer membrane protein assembly factor BamB